MKTGTRSSGAKHKWIWFLTGVLLIGLLIAGGIYFYLGQFHFSLKTDAELQIQLDYGSEYVPPQIMTVFEGTFWRKGPAAPEVPITRTGEVDTGTLGTYPVRFSARYGIWDAELVQTVTVVDRIAPIIELVSDPDAFTVPGEPYREEGYRAVDEYDGDLTDKVVRKEQDGMVTYTVRDSSNNEAIVQRQIHYHDPTPPQLDIFGASSCTLPSGRRYIEPGFHATDNVDGDLTDRVEVTGTVDHYKAGTYTISYSVTDSYQNTAQATRTVEVVPSPQPDNPVGDKVIYLTFDDGPGPYTRQLLDVLEKYNVKATFFVMNGGYNPLMKEIAEAGHAIGMHTVTHNYRSIYGSEKAFFGDLYGIQDIIYSQTGIRPSIMRFPGGSSNTVSRFNPGIMTTLTQQVEQKGMTYFDWNVDSNDAGGASTAQEVFDNVTSGIAGKDQAVVLQHDVKQFSVEAVERIIGWGMEQGYVFLPLSTDSPTCHHGVNN